RPGKPRETRSRPSLALAALVRMAFRIVLRYNSCDNSTDGCISQFHAPLWGMAPVGAFFFASCSSLMPAKTLRSKTGVRKLYKNFTSQRKPKAEIAFLLQDWE